MIMYSICMNYELIAIFMDYLFALDYVISLYNSTGSKHIVLYKDVPLYDDIVERTKICSSDEF